MIRVLHVVPDLIPYGLEKMVASLCLRASSHVQPAVISLYADAPGSLTQPLRAAGVRVWHLDKKRGLDLRMIPRIAAVLRDFQPDVLHTHNYVLRYTAAPALWHRVPTQVHTIHNVADQEVDLVGRLLQRACFPNLVHPVAIAGRVAESFAKVYGYAAPTLIPNGIPVHLYKAERGVREFWRRKEGFTAEQILILCVARLFPQKNHRTLVDAFARVASNNSAATLVLAGDGELEGEIREQCAELGITDRVRFLGRREDIASTLAAADIFALASSWEGNPLSVMEAMAAGLPAAVTSVGAIPELVRDGRDGFLARAGDAAGFASNLSRLVDDAELRREMGESGRARARERFSEESMVAAYESLYQRLMPEARGRAAMPVLVKKGS